MQGLGSCHAAIEAVHRQMMASNHAESVRPHAPWAYPASLPHLSEVCVAAAWLLAQPPQLQPGCCSGAQAQRRRGLAPAAGGPPHSCVVLPAQVQLCSDWALRAVGQSACTSPWKHSEWAKRRSYFRAKRVTSSPSFRQPHLPQQAAAQSICVHLQTLRHALRFCRSDRS